MSLLYHHHYPCKFKRDVKGLHNGEKITKRLLICGILLLLMAVCSTVYAASTDLNSVYKDPYDKGTTITQSPESTVTCNAPCECMDLASADANWGPNGYSMCSKIPCGYSKDMKGNPVEQFCIQPVEVPVVFATTPETVSCQKPCGCMDLATADATWGPGGYSMCSKLPCGYSKNLKGNPVEQYCIRPVNVPVMTTTATISTERLAVPVSLLVTTTPSSVASVNRSMFTTDTDRDGFPDYSDNCPRRHNPYQYDMDGDSIGDSCDNCERVVNPDQAGSDSDSFGDACDNCPYLASDDQTDSDHDGVGDVCQDPCSMNADNVTSFSWRTWRGPNRMTSVKDQAGCGSCYVMSPLGAMEAKYNIEQGNQTNLDLSEQMYVSPCSGIGNVGSCYGGWRNEVLSRLKNEGVTEDACLPYQSLDCLHSEPNPANTSETHDVCNIGCNTTGHCSNPTNCPRCSDWSSRRWKIRTYAESSGSVKSVKQAILCNGPLSVCSGKWWHCVVLVGWETSPYYGGSWIIKNSWGAGWNGDGYGTIPFEGNDYSEIRNDSWYVGGIYHA